MYVQHENDDDPNAIFSLFLSLSLAHRPSSRTMRGVYTRVSSIDFSPQRAPSRFDIIIGTYRVSRRRPARNDFLLIYFTFFFSSARDLTIQQRTRAGGIPLLLTYT